MECLGLSQQRSHHRDDVDGEDYEDDDDGDGDGDGNGDGDSDGDGGVTRVKMLMVTTVKTVRAMVIRYMMQWQHSCKRMSRRMSPAILAKHFGSRLCR